MRRFFQQHKGFVNAWNRVFGWIHRYNKAVFALCACAALLLTGLFAGLIFAYRVVYNGEGIALIRSKDKYQQAVELVRQKVACDDLSDYTVSPSFALAITTVDHITSTDELAESIITHTDSIYSVDGLYIDGVLEGCLSCEENLGELVQEYLDSFNPAEGEAESHFCVPVTVEPVYAVDASLSDPLVLLERLKELDVRTTVTARERHTIPFEVINRKSSDRPIGEVYCVVKGVEGIVETPTVSTYINGELVDVTEGESVVIQAQVDEVNVIGIYAAASSGSGSRTDLGAVWPLQRTGNQMISAYFGDGRNHKGIDIASPYGTPILACQSGTVIVSEYNSSYGNYVVIRHANGYETLYAHASRLHVSVGETVVQGQVIAAVGSTGYSTGNHLHFEVHYGSEKLNPAPFLGID